MLENYGFMAISKVLLYVLWVFLPASLLSQPSSNQGTLNLLIRKASYKRVPPSRNSAPLFAVPFLHTHRSPKEDQFIELLRLGEGTELDEQGLLETQQNLAFSRLFSRIDVVIDTLSPELGELPNEANIRLLLHEKPRFAPFLVLQSGGAAMNLGVGVSFANLGDLGTALRLQLHQRDENAIGLQADMRWDLFLGETDSQQPLIMNASAWANRWNFGVEGSIVAPFSNFQPYNEWSARVSYFGGNEFAYTIPERSSMLLPAQYRPTPFSSARLNATGIVSGSYWGTGFYLSGTMQVDVSRRDSTSFFIPSNSFDNTVLFLAELGTEVRKITVINERLWGSAEQRSGRALGEMIETGFHLQGGLIGGFRLNHYGTTFQFPQGAFGSAPVYPTGRFAYSFFSGENFYSALKAEFGGESPFGISFKAHLAIANGVVLATRVRGEIANGGVIILDSDNGVRGLGLNTLLGGFSSAVFNAELRGLPIGEIGSYKLTGTVFIDAASVDNGRLFRQNVPISHISSVGVGLRLKYPSLLSESGEQGIFRVDLAYLEGNPWRFGQIILSTKEAFTLFDDLPRRQERLVATRRFAE